MNQLTDNQSLAARLSCNHSFSSPPLDNQSRPNGSLLCQFGNATERVEKAIALLQSGQGVLLVDDEDRENEGDLIFSTQFLNESQMAMLIRECSGIVCLCLTDEKIAQLKLPPMVKNNTSQYGTAFTVSIEAAEHVTTGVSASDRVTTVKTAVANNAKPSDLNHPGHVFPLRAHPKGVLARRGHTEGTIELMQLAGLDDSGVLCELTNPDGTMARLPAIINFAQQHNMVVLSIEDLVEYRLNQIDNAS
ncbi:3,4-dihydroxy-2-butanone-4-phosphate synthase [Aliikangiella coralliicola]|uniref:3,4-dihydroxy-2-butanone 4-phosphate synthase n=1 Tax=Aliikangiella coralliicola TaxID=2592383 RepID=A0A545TV09_9GAMM|nr:3,4-dihydroxy-2-butanone-4-phosphate synthase [Aliikangiella coralliicola]TQV81054.1 3,4-dihydroxy-2-butanone-4-phosphate synthase [Aliikangiella coralliicola]